MENIYGRKVAIKALVGSHNYNLNTINSDKDYKYFVFPTFDDLYSGKMFSTARQSEELDFDVHDIRQLANLLWKANLNFIEVLYSKDIIFDHNLVPLFLRKYDFSRMNLPTFYNATYGMHLMKMKALHKGTAKTQVLVDTYGYDTKQACHALRCLMVLERVAMEMSIGEALWFPDGSFERTTLLSIKRGEVSESDFMVLVENWHDNFHLMVKQWFSNQKANEKDRDAVDGLIKEIIKLELI